MKNIVQIRYVDLWHVLTLTLESGEKGYGIAQKNWKTNSYLKKSTFFVDGSSRFTSELQPL